MTEQEDQQTPQTQEPEPAGDGRLPDSDHRIEDLREMEEKGDHLNEVIEDARSAVAAAHEASSMRLEGAGDADVEEEVGPQTGGQSGG